MNPLVPTGASVLSKEECELVPQKLLSFNFTMQTAFMYTEVLGLKLEEFRFRDAEGQPCIELIRSLLYAGLYDDRDPQFINWAKDEIARSITPNVAPIVNRMISEVIDRSTDTGKERRSPKARSP